MKHTQLNSNAPQKGFTLIEMLFVVAIIAVLAAIAIPSYNNYVNRGKLKTAQSDLVALGLNLENQYQRVLSYPAAALADTDALKGAFSGWSPASASSDFTFATADASSSTYTVKATGINGGVQGCVISLKHDGTKTISSCTNYASSGVWL